MMMGRLVPAMAVAILLGAIGCSSEPTEPKLDGALKAEILDFAASAGDTSPGTEIELHWTTRNAVSLELSSDVDGVIELGDADLDEGTVTVRPEETTLYTLRATGAAGDRVEQSVEVRVSEALVASLSATPTSIAPGESATLSWTTAAAASVSLSDGNAELLETQDQWSGTLTVTPSSTTTYTLRAIRDEEEQTSSVTIEVNPLVLEFAAVSEGPFVVGDPVELSWKTAGAIDVVLTTPEGGEVTVDSSLVEEGTSSLAVGASGQFEIIAKSGDLEARQTLEVALLEIPTIHVFEPSADAVTAGQEVTVTWEVEGAAALTLEVNGSGVPADGESYTTTIEESTTFTLIAQNAAGQATETIEVRAVPLPTISFTVPPRVEAGQPFELSWSVTDGAWIELERDGAPVDGVSGGDLASQLSQTVAAATVYELRAFNELGAFVARSAVVTVGAPTIVSFVAVPNRLAPGASLELSWQTMGGSSLRILGPGGEEAACATSDLERIAAGSCTITAPLSLGLHPFTLTVENGLAERDEETEEVEVYEGPRVLAFSVEPVRSTQGDPITFTWEVESDAYGRAPSLSIQDPADESTYPISAGDAAAGSTTFAPAAAGDRSLRLVASTPDTDDGSLSTSVEILPEPTVKLSSSVASYDDAPAELTWTAAHAASVALYELDAEFRLILPALFESNDPGQVRGEGMKIEVVPQPPEGNYRLIVTNELGATRQSSVTVERLPVQIDTFSLSRPVAVASVHEVEFSWSTRRATQVWIEPSDFRTTDAFIDISGSPTAKKLQLTDDCLVDLSSGDPMECGGFDFPEGFEFPYYGQTYSQARASVNGFLSFDMRYAGDLRDSELLPEPLARGVHLAPLWRHFKIFENGTRPGGVFYDLGQDADGRYLVIQWKGMHSGNIALPTDTRTDFNFQIVLREDGNFDFRYGELKVLGWTDLGALLSIGYQNPDGTEGKSLKSGELEYPGGLEGWAFAMRPAGFPTSGSWSGYPLTTGTYTLVATDGANNRTQTQSLTVHPRAWWPFPNSVQWTASVSPSAPSPGDTLTVTWSQSQNAQAIDVLDENGNKLCGQTDPAQMRFGNCSFTENRSGELVYTVRAYGAGGAALDNFFDARAVAPIYAAPFIQSLRATPSPITPGETAMLSWVIDDATSITLTEKIGSDPATPIDVTGLSPTNGSVAVSPATSAIYTLVATRQETFTSKAANTTYQLPVDTVRMSDLTATKTNLLAGESSTLSWSAAGEGTVSVGPLPMRSLPVEFHDISESETKNTLTWGALTNGTRSATITFPEGFSFRYFGETHSSINVIEDGSLSFHSTSGNPHQYGYGGVGALGNPLPSTRIGPFWAGLKTYSVGEAHWERFQVGGEDFIVVQFNRFQLPVLPAPTPGSETDNLTFQVVLFNDGASQDGRFDFRYQTMSSDNNQEGADGKAASIGFQSSDGKQSGELAFFEVVTGGLSGRSWRFEPVDLSTGTMTVTPWKTTNYKACIADATRTVCETIRITVPALGDLLITELHLQPAAGSAQWFEVRNTSVGPIDMNGMSIVGNGGSHTINNGGPLVVEPGGYLTFAASATPGFTPSYNYGGIPVLNAADDQLTIYNGTNPEALIAEARWQGWTIESGRSKSLDPSRHRPGLLSDRTEGSWCTEGTESYVAGNFGTPGTTGAGCLPGLYILDAYSADPFIDIEPTGTKLAIGTGRTPPVSAAVPGGIGFDMPFFDGTVNTLWISQNGVVGLGGSHSNPKAREIPGTGTGFNVGFVAGHWSNWGIGAAANNAAFLYEKQERDGKKVTILQWTRVTTTVWVDPLFPPFNPPPPDPGEGTFQVQLWEDGDIVIVYKDLVRGLRALGSETSVGIEAPGGTTGVRYSWNEPVLKGGQSLRFQRKQPPAP